ncbi:MAG: GntR family transcriptional regulator [Candidatus Sericytochromatia bacterium]|nr:GntR family transcriptional regulator [Candidatus Tanganyikabacteria bacterium]
MGSVDLSPRQAAIVNLIRAAAASGQPVPSQQELAAAIGVRSASTVNRHLQALARKGVLKWTRWRNRAVVLVEKAERCTSCGRTRDLPEGTGARSEGTLPLSATEAAVFVAICESLQADRMVLPSTLARQLDRHIVEIWQAVDALRAQADFAVARVSPQPGPPEAARHHDSYQKGSAL